jgi:hypothetical protein
VARFRSSETEVTPSDWLLENVKYYQKGFKPYVNNPIHKTKNENFEKVRTSFYGGWSYLTAQVSKDVPADFRSYTKGLKSGHHFGGDVGYFWSENIGLGLKTTIFKTKNELNNIYVTNNETKQTRYGNMKDDISIQYFAPVLYTRFYSGNRKTVFFSNFSLGYLNYKNRATLIDDFKITGNTIGYEIDFGTDLKLNNRLSFNLGLGLTAGSLNKLEINNGSSTQVKTLEKEKRENISRLDVSMGLSYSL